jgi:hypothetical protein
VLFPLTPALSLGERVKLYRLVGVLMILDSIQRKDGSLKK